MRRIQEVNSCGPGSPAITAREQIPVNTAKGITKKRHIMKKIWSIIACLMMVLAICSPVFAADTSVTATLPMLTDEEMDIMHQKEIQKYALYSIPIYDCPNCPAAQCLALYCVRPMSVSHTTTHSTSSGVCSILWHTATIAINVRLRLY